MHFLIHTHELTNTDGEAEPYASYSAMSVSGPPSDAEMESESLKGDNEESDVTQELAKCNGTAGQ